MADHSAKHDSDTGAAFIGLIGGVLLIGIILYVIVIMTNKQFEGHSKAQSKTSAITAVMASVA